MSDISAGTLGRDEQQLAELGYKQELQRAWGSFTNFAISFTIISVLAGTFTTFSLAWTNGGPLAASVGWAGLCFFVVIVGVSMAGVASRVPPPRGAFRGGPDLGARGWGWMSGAL